MPRTRGAGKHGNLPPAGRIQCHAAAAETRPEASGSTVTNPHQQPVRGRRRGYRRLLARALAVSALLHLALFALWRAEPPSPAGTGADADEAPAPAPPPETALQAVDVRPTAEDGAEAGRPAARLPEADLPPVREPSSARAGELALRPVRPSGAARAVLPGEGGSAAAGEDGDGSRGEPGRISPPVPRSLLPQWDPPDPVQGTRVTVHVEVGRDGRPTGQVRLEPPTGDEDFDRRLREALTSIRYRPGRRAGEPVVAWAEITFVF